MTVRLIFDVKMNLTRKARLVTDGHKTPDIVESTYAGVMSRGLVQVLLTFAALMGINVWEADIQNTSISALPIDRLWIISVGLNLGWRCIGRREQL